MQNIEVKEITSKSGTNKNGNWTQFTILTKDGAKFSTFDTKFEEIKPGSILAVELEANGKYTNIKEWKLISEPVAKNDSPILPNGALEIACLQEVGHYIRGADMQVADAPLKAIVDKYWQIIDKNLDSLLGETKAPIGETKPAAGEIPTFKAGHELVNYYLKLDCPIDKIKEVLGIKNPTEITDVKAAAEKMYAYFHSIK